MVGADEDACAMGRVDVGKIGRAERPLIVIFVGSWIGTAELVDPKAPTLTGGAASRGLVMDKAFPPCACPAGGLTIPVPVPAAPEFPAIVVVTGVELVGGGIDFAIFAAVRPIPETTMLGACCLPCGFLFNGGIQFAFGERPLSSSKDAGFFCSRRLSVISPFV